MILMRRSSIAPERCRKCGRELSGDERLVGRPVRHQVIELPDSGVVTVEHRLLKVCCPGCQAHTRAELPDHVERGAFGPRLRATVVMLAVMLLSRRRTLTLLKDMFGARISLGSLERILKDASDALAAPWEAIARFKRARSPMLTRRAGPEPVSDYGCGARSRRPRRATASTRRGPDPPRGSYSATSMAC
jgi:transposase